MHADLSPPPLVVPPAITVPQVTRIIRRNLRRAAYGSVLGLLAGGAYLGLVHPTYTATSVLMIDQRKVRAVQDAYAFASTGANTADIDLATQIELFKSDRLAGIVAKRLAIHRGSPALEPPPSRLDPAMRHIKALLGLDNLAAQPVNHGGSEAGRNEIVDLLKDAVAARRIPRTQILEISFTAHDAKHAAEAADAYADAYILDQLETERAAARRASVWLQEQLTNLKDSVQSSERAVQSFKSTHEMLVTNGRPIDDHKLADVLANLQLLRAETNKAEARHDKLRQIIAENRKDALMTDTFTDPQMVQLRGQYLNLVRGETQLVKRVGEDHQAVVRLRSEKEEFNRLMRSELNRIAATYASELDIAREREKKLTEEFEGLAGRSRQSAVAQIELRELERSSDTYRAFYAVVLQRNLEALQQESFSDRNARIITNARIPESRSGPSDKRLLAISLILGAMAGGVFGLLREAVDRSFRSSGQVRTSLGVARTWTVPRLSLTRAEVTAASGDKPADNGTARDRAMLSVARSRSSGPLSEILIDIKTRLDAIDGPDGARVIGVVSLAAGAGASTLAANLATLIAATGSRTVLVDGDPKAATLTRLLGAESEEPDHHGATGSAKPAALRRMFDGGPAFIPLLRAAPATSSNIVVPLAPPTRQVLDSLRGDFDYVVLDLPPVAASSAATTLAAHLDAYVVVVEWGRDDRTRAGELLRAERPLAQKCIGAVLNKTDLDVLAQYEPADAGITRRKN